MTNIKSVNIEGIKIRQDEHGRFNLNDLHKSSGGAKTNQPHNFMRRAETEALIAEIENSSDVRSIPPAEKKTGRGGGTYVCKELVYSYAMWISPAFQLRVIRAYDAMAQDEVRLAEGRASRQAARLEAPFLTDAVKHTREAKGKGISHYHFSNEFDLINRIALGKTAKQYRAEHGLAATDAVRDFMTPCEIKCIEHLQRVNASLIDIGMAFDERKARLHQIYCQRHAAALCREVAALES